MGAFGLVLFGVALIEFRARRINTVEEVAADRALIERGLLFALSDANGRIVPQIGLGIQIDDRTSVPRSLPPYLGEHTDEVLGKLA